MANVSTNLMSALLNNESIDEVFRSELENAVNEVLSTELTASLDYEKYDYSGRNSGDSRNGFYDRTYQSRFGTLNLRIPRDREGLFKQHTIPSYQACWTHLCRNVMKYVRAKDKSTVMNELKLVYNATSPAEAESILYDFIVKYSKIYPKAVAVLEDLTSFFEFYEFPAVIRRSIYTTNLIENLNKISNVEPSVKSSSLTKILLKDMFAAFIATITRQCTVVYIKALKNVALNWKRCLCNS